MALGYVRPAIADDAAEIARIQLATWRLAYRRILPGPALERLDESWMARRWLAAIEEPPTPGHHILVAIEQAERSCLVGFAASGPADEQVLAPGETLESLPAPGGSPAAVTDLLVEPRWGRRGHGSRLLAACVDAWRGDGRRIALAWAYEADVATQKFLSSAGWEPDGATRALDVDDRLVRQLRLHVAIDA